LKRFSIAVLGFGLAVLIAAAVVSALRSPVEPKRPPPGGNTQFITVQSNVELEVIDFGGIGRPLVLLAGHGATAHAFAPFSTDLTAKYHVYGITRRGFGLSSAPVSGYTAERLGDDVVAVIDTLRLVRPVLVGHSMAGEELSSVATFHPEKVSGLVYIDAAGSYALYDKIHADLTMRVAAVAGLIDLLIPSAIEPLTLKILAGQRRFTELHVPVLAIFADPHDLSAKFKDVAKRTEAEARDRAHTELQIEAIQRQVPAAKIVRVPYASHVIYRSNEAEVLRDIDSFIGSLP
jgi:non-heme chloroperoxidase